MVRVGLVQISVTEDLNLNLARALDLVEGAADRGAEIVCLPELYRTPYFPREDRAQVQHYAETIPGESTAAFSKLAARKNIAVIVPLFERYGSVYYNSAAVIDADGSIAGVYRKSHIPCDPMFYEKRYFSEGDGFRVFRTKHACVAVLICYDQWFPEAARAVVLDGADIIFYPTAIGRIRGVEESEGDWQAAWETVQRGHAIANGVHVAAVNRVGVEGEIAFWGGSFVCDSFGSFIAHAGADEEILIADLDLSKNVMVREGWGFLRNRRPDAYRSLVKDPERLSATPRCDGYHMPAEWERHDGVWLAWPHDTDTFNDIDSVERAYVSMIKALHVGETVNLLVRDEEMRERVEHLLQRDVRMSSLRIHTMDYADVWFRDYGPTFVVNRNEKRLGMVAWNFNAWGGKYCELMGDVKIPCYIARDLGVRCFRPGIVLEGGSIDVNGSGTLMTTEQCLLNPNRNPHLSRWEIEFYLREYLGVRKIIWLRRGIAGDDTDGHVDDVARFVSPRRVVVAFEDDRDDENYKPLRENCEILKHETDQDGNPLEVIRLPMPGYVGDDHRLPASYANFYIGNSAVLVPVFGHRNDARALSIIGALFPDRKIVGIDALAMVYGLGTVHCVTQQQPAAY
ncbi:agmatine deiminase family protein [Methanothrix sp.]|uniref:agmatine deiminase family protein n=1 Tax=Methanothrix sp. TaxID=90426 RepID=UPI0034E2172E